MEMGILVGSDRTHEWLLPWWWERYTKYNAYPVAFANFGMSIQALAWCRERGMVLDVAPCPPVLPQDIPGRLHDKLFDTEQLQSVDWIPSSHSSL